MTIEHSRRSILKHATFAFAAAGSYATSRANDDIVRDGDRCNYAIATTAGTATKRMVDEVGGLVLPAMALSLKTDDVASFLSLRWSDLSISSLHNGTRLRARRTRRFDAISHSQRIPL